MLVSIKMKKDLERTIELPEGIEAKIEENSVTMKGNGKELTNSFNNNKIDMTVKGNKIKLVSKNATRRQSKMMGTIDAHIKNMIKGVTDGFEYKLEICNVHFPMNVKQEDGKIIIKSFLGETTKRVARIMPTTNVDIKGSQITVTSSSIENAGQTAANIEKATRLTGRDRRVFQDGIFITEKNGRKI